MVTEPSSSKCNWCTQRKPLIPGKNSARAVPRMDENAGGVTDPCPSAFTVRERMSAIDALTDTDGGRPGEEIKRRWRVQ